MTEGKRAQNSEVHQHCQLRRSTLDKNRPRKMERFSGGLHPAVDGQGQCEIECGSGQVVIEDVLWSECKWTTLTNKLFYFFEASRHKVT